MLVSMIRSEVDRAVGRMGFVREDELAALRRHVQRLEQQLDELRGQSRPSGAGEKVEPLAQPASGLTADPDSKQAAEAKTGVEPKAEADDAPAPVIRKKKKVVVEPSGPATDAG
jgi:hypothetical protein